MGFLTILTKYFSTIVIIDVVNSKNIPDENTNFLSNSDM